MFLKIFVKRASWTTNSTPHFIIHYQASHLMRVLNLSNRDLTCLPTVESSFLLRTLFAAELATSTTKRIILLFQITITTLHSYLTYLDANNLYGGAIRKPCQKEISPFSQRTRSHRSTLQQNSTTTATFLNYPEHLHDTHYDYPLDAEKLRITK